MYREETSEERQHQDRVDAAHEKLYRAVNKLGEALPWFEGEIDSGALTDENAATYLEQRDLVRAHTRLNRVCLEC